MTDIHARHHLYLRGQITGHNQWLFVPFLGHSLAVVILLILYLIMTDIHVCHHLYFRGQITGNNQWLSVATLGYSGSHNLTKSAPINTDIRP